MQDLLTFDRPSDTRVRKEWGANESSPLTAYQDDPASSLLDRVDTEKIHEEFREKKAS